MLKVFGRFLVLMLVLSCGFVAGAEGEAPETSKTFVIVHGAWGGGWAFREVESLLEARGHKVYRPTLTGQGERVHLASREVGLEVHILDVVNMILFEALEDVVLVGHSYGGMVVTGVADRVPERIGHLIYLDAMVPEDGESAATVGRKDGEMPRWMASAKDGFIVPSWVDADQAPPKDVPHQLKTLTDPIVLKNPDRMKLATDYILTVEKDTDAKDDGFYRHSERARGYGWDVHLLTGDHNMQWSAPVALVEMLLVASKP